MPAGVVDQENNDAVASRPGLLCEDVQQFLEVGLGYAGVNIPEAFSRRRRDESGDVEPFEAMMTESDWALANGRPYSARDGL
jgi:hypothetical protein